MIAKAIKLYLNFILLHSNNSPVWFNNCYRDSEERSSLWTADIISGHLKQRQTEESCYNKLTMKCSSVSMTWFQTSFELSVFPLSTIISIFYQQLTTVESRLEEPALSRASYSKVVFLKSASPSQTVQFYPRFLKSFSFPFEVQET